MIIALLGLCGAAGSGCAMCSPGFLDDYATVGGKWQRDNPTHGRVGSIFSDTGSGGMLYEDELYHAGEIHSGQYEKVYSEEASVLDGETIYVDQPSSDQDVIILGEDW